MAYKSKTKFPEISNPSITSYCHVDPEEVKKGLRPACSVHVHKVNATAASDAGLDSVKEAGFAMSAAEYLSNIDSLERTQKEEAKLAARSKFEQREALLKEEHAVIASRAEDSFNEQAELGALPAVVKALEILDKYEFYPESTNNTLSEEDEMAVLDYTIAAVAVAEMSKQNNLGLVNEEYVAEAARVRALLFDSSNRGELSYPARLPLQENYDYNGSNLNYKSPSDVVVNFLYGMKNNSYRNEKVRSNVHKFLTEKLERPIENYEYAPKPKRGFLGLFNRG